MFNAIILLNEFLYNYYFYGIFHKSAPSFLWISPNIQETLLCYVFVFSDIRFLITEHSAGQERITNATKTNSSFRLLQIP